MRGTGAAGQSGVESMTGNQGMTVKSILRTGAAVLAVLATSAMGSALRAQELPETTRLSVLEAKLSSAEKQLTLIEDVQAIKRLQSAYGYYRSKGMADEIANLFSDNPTVSVELAGRGVFMGKERIRQFFSHAANQVKEGQLYNEVIGQGVVHVDPESNTAKGRWRALIQEGTYGEDGHWIEGPFENEYVKENGVWKFSKIHWYQTVKGSYDKGWNGQNFQPPGPLADLPPDEPPTADFKSYPEPFFKPYHYLHPVTGKPVNSTQGAAK